MRATRRVILVAVVASAPIACHDPPPGRTFYQRTIEPILVQKCAGNTSGCHSTNDDDMFKFAAGNLDVTTFENVQKRRDLLVPFGAYQYSPFLIKAVGANALKVPYNGVFLDIDIQHSGGAIIEPGSDAFYTLSSWLDNGATENGLKPASPPQNGGGVACQTAIPSGFDGTAILSDPNFATFKSNVQPILTAKNCTAGACHGAPQSDFYITCGSDDMQLAFNFSQAKAFVNMTVDDSQLLRVPLAVGTGGRGHTGGDQFASPQDADYVTIRTWAEAVGPQDFAMGNPVKQFFADNVQPVLLKRGCAVQGCHSPQAGNDFKLRSGTQNFFSAVALEKNYDLLRNEFMALEFPDARRGRAVAKGVLFDDPRTTSVGGIAHRGGAVLETAGTTSEPSACPGTFNPMTATPFCAIQEWLRLERAALLAANQVTSMDPGDTIPLVYVDRPTGGVAGRLEFDTFQGGADLRRIDLTFGAGQVLQSADAGTSTSLLGGCAGLTPGTADVQAPDVANDGTRVAFAARNSANEPLSVWVVNIDGSSCTRITPAAADSNGLKVHDFDPAWAPDGSQLVFASTRGKAGVGATRSRKRFLPQSDLWRIAISGTSGTGVPQQMTWLSNSEISPSFMREGRVAMTTEKASDGFYQLAGRRINWDLTDYHPLLAQRATSAFGFDNTTMDLAATKPSVDYGSATDIREGSNGDFLVILADVGADGAPAVRGGAGALAIFNRSIGPFEAGRRDAGFLASMRILDAGAATGRAGAATGYRAPSSLPDGSILVSYASSTTTLDWTLVSVSPRTGTRTPLVTGGAGRAKVDGVLAYRAPPHELYDNRRQLVFGGFGEAKSGVDQDHAILHMPDAPMTFTLLTANLRRGRPVEQFRAARSIVVWEEKGCPAGPCSATAGGIYESRTELGRTALASDGSLRVRLPAKTGLVFGLVDGNGANVVTMSEEHQMGPGESISMGVSEKLFDAVCGGCHGSVSGEELDVAVTPDALTGASQSMSAGADPVGVGP